MKRFFLALAGFAFLILPLSCRKEAAQPDRYLLSSEITVLGIQSAKTTAGTEYKFLIEISVEAANRLDGYGLGQPDSSVTLTLIGAMGQIEMPTITTFRMTAFNPCTFVTFGSLKDRTSPGYAFIITTDVFLPTLLQVLGIDEETFWNQI